jgi:serine/threonine-protein kinase HipA
MAVDCGIQMMPCRLHEENGRAHFMTKRFDRHGDAKRHVQSLCALHHYDFNKAREYSYEQAIQACRRLQLKAAEIEQQVRRAFFNILARNQDDHTKNIAFIMDKSGAWSLSPAFDVAYAYNPEKFWTREHQMSVNEKTDGFSRDDLLGLARFAGLKTPRAKQILKEISASVSDWNVFAEKANVPSTKIARIRNAHRSYLFAA